MKFTVDFGFLERVGVPLLLLLLLLLLPRPRRGFDSALCYRSRNFARYLRAVLAIALSYLY